MTYTIEPVPNRDQWDELLAKSQTPTVFHTWEWKTFLEKRGYESRYVLVKDIGKEIQAGCAFVLTRSFRFFRIYNSLPLYGLQGGGPLLAVDGNKRWVCESLVDWLSTRSLSTRIVGSRVVTTDEEMATHLRARGMSTLARHGFMITDLEKTPPEIIWSRIFSHEGKQRTEIRKFERLGTEMRMGTDRTALDKFEELHRVSLVRLKAPPLPRSFYTDLWNALSPKYLQIGLVSLGRKTICGCIILPFPEGRTVNLFLIGYDRENLGNLSSMLFVIWRMIEWASNNGFRYVNLGRTPTNQADRHYLFKSQFAGSMLPLHDIRLLPHPKLYWLVRRISIWGK